MPSLSINSISLDTLHPSTPAFGGMRRAFSYAWCSFMYSGGYMWLWVSIRVLAACALTAGAPATAAAPTAAAPARNRRRDGLETSQSGQLWNSISASSLS
jgi:hypothetical protein